MEGVTQFGWLESMRLGHHALDRDHEEIVGLVEGAVARAEQRGDRDEILWHLKAVKRLFAAHCRYEEALMRDVADILGLKEIDRHIEGHRTFMADISALEAYIEGGGDPANTGGLRWQVLQGLLEDLLDADSILVGALLKSGRYQPRAA